MSESREGIHWHEADVKKVFSRLDSSPAGLDSSLASNRLENEGENRLVEGKTISPISIFVSQFKDFLIVLLIIAAFVSIAIGVYEESIQEMLEAGLILIIIVFIVVVGFYQEYSAEKELEALKQLMSPNATVVRDGEKHVVNASQLVLGDVVLLEAGSHVPADLRIFESSELRVDESSLTGESSPVGKTTAVLDADTDLADRENMAYMGTSCVFGKGRGIVVGKSMDTEIGKIAGHISEITEIKTPLQARLEDLGKQIGLVVIVLCAIVFAAGLLTQSKPPLEMLIIAIALAVAAVPEGLPGVVTVALASGTRRMVRENVIIRKLPAVETLGSTTVICTDKTGTLTKNEMTVKKAWVDGRLYGVSGEGYGTDGFFTDGSGEKTNEFPQAFQRMLEAAVLCNDAELNEQGVTGSPTEASILVAGIKGGLKPKDLNKKHPRVHEIPFSSERKMSTTVNETEDGLTVYSKGAPDYIIRKCTHIIVEGVEEELTEKRIEEIQKANQDFAEDAYRVLGFAYRRVKDDFQEDSAEDGLVFTGLMAIIDPPRPESRKSVEKCEKAGIRVVMITGDHLLTAKSIARQLGIHKEGDLALTGRELDAMSEEEFMEKVDSISVYARVTPTHKLKIVTALQKKDNVVAMTGDGVNDAPALKRADIGVAMGIVGTDVSKEAADMVLTDDNFASIVAAVEEGRGIYDNIRKFFAYLISGNIGEVAVVFLSSIIGSVPIALTATQILIVNFVTDAFPALALGVDPFEPGAMSRKPRKKKEPIYHNLRPFILWYPLIMIAATMGLFLWVYDSAKNNVMEAQTVAFMSINLFESFQAFSARSTRYPSLKVGLFRNKWLLLAIIFSIVILPILMYVPLHIPFTGYTLQEMTHIYPLSPGMFLFIMLVSVIGFLYLEVAKWWGTRGEEYETDSGE